MTAGDGSAPPERTFFGINSLTWQKIVPLGFMFFCILFNYTILRDTKVSENAWPAAMAKLGLGLSPLQPLVYGPASHALSQLPQTLYRQSSVLESC